tara:strand:+ start:644 stop:2113 length:1470 start_codon:yes stop_codon:yes gene_type:complete
MVVADGYPLHRAGSDMFFAVSGIMIFLCNIAGIYLTADCLSEEKRNGTLGLLFLTNLRGYEVVLGKMSVGTIQAVLGLLAAVPMLVVPVLMGGVDPMLVLRMAVVLFATLFLSLSVGIVCSAIFKSSKVATGMALGIMLFLNFGPGLIYEILYEIFGRIMVSGISDIYIFSTGYIYALTCEGGLGLGGQTDVEFNISMAVVLGIAILSILFAIWKTARTWQDQPVKIVTGVVSQKSSNAAHRRARVLDKNPLHWLAARKKFGPGFVWLAFIIVFTFMMIVTDGFQYLFGFSNSRYSASGSFLMTLWVVSTMLKWWMAGAACERFRVDRGESALELLLSTPLEYQDFARAHRERIRWQFLWPVVLILCLIPFMMGLSSDDALKLYIVGILMFFIDVWATYFVGMHTSLTLRKPVYSSSLVVLKIHILPYLIFLVLILIAATTNSGMDENGALAIWFLVGLLNNAFWVGRANLFLGEKFRETAARAVSPGS